MGAIRMSTRRGRVRELASALAGGPSALVAFVSRYSVPDEATGCWNWIGPKSSTGYAYMVDPRQPIIRECMPRTPVHRMVCEVVYRPMTDEEHARHLCHNKGCVNPKHLAPGSVSDNLNDSVRDGLWTFTRGEGNGRAKVTDDDVRRLRANFQPHTRGQTDIWCRALGISETSVRNIAAGRTWPHVKQEPV